MLYLLTALIAFIIGVFAMALLAAAKDDDLLGEEILRRDITDD